MHRLLVLVGIVVALAIALPTSTQAASFTEVIRLTASEADGGFGASVAVSGDTAVVGANGAAYVFERNQGSQDSWQEVEKLTTFDAGAFDGFGVSVAVSGDTAVVGAYHAGAGGSAVGAAYVFQRNQGGSGNWGEVTKLTAPNAQAEDRFGWTVAVSGDTAVVGAHLDDAGGAFAGAAYVFQRDQGGAETWGRVTKLTASDAQTRDFFGWSVAVSGDTAVVGAFWEDAGGSNAGAAYVFQRDQGGTDNWGEVKKLLASDAQADDEFGVRVAVSGDTAVVGAYYEDAGGDNAGAAYVFRRDQGSQDNWGEVTKLTASDARADDTFGWSAAVSGDTVVVGARWGNNAGAVYVFQLIEGSQDNWGEVTKLTASDAQAGDGVGLSVAVSGDSAFVGAPWKDAGGDCCDFAGAVYLFERDQGSSDNWGEVTKLLASDAQASDGFGVSVAVSGDTAVVGANGAAYVFQRSEGSQGNWGEVKKLTAADPEAGDIFGISVAISGDTAVVGAVGAGGGIAGAAYVFQRDQGGADDWGEVAKLTASDAEAGDGFGISVAVSGGTALVGAFLESAGGSNAGAAYVFQRDEGSADSWGEVTKLTASDASGDALFGRTVAVSGDTAVVGAVGDDAGGSFAGAAYVFRRDQGNQDNWGEVKKLTASDTDAFLRFGLSVTVSGDTVIVSAPVAAYVFQRDQDGAENWGEVKKLTASGTQAPDNFGVSVAVSGDTAVVGALFQNADGCCAGAAYVFQRNQGGADNWGEVKKITTTCPRGNDGFGRSVAVSGDTAIVGASGPDQRNEGGAAYVFQEPPHQATLAPCPPVQGDASCDGNVNAIDAALILQFSAGLLGALDCQDAADVNGDGEINSIDAALILQFVAGLIDSLYP